MPSRSDRGIVLIGNDLETLVETARIVRRARSIIYQNLVGTLTVDAVGVVLATYGLLPPLAPAFVHMASELLFILNSARLLPRRSRLASVA